MQKNYVYFSIKINFLYFIYLTFQNTPNQIIYFILYYIKLLIFVIVSLSLHTIITIYSLLSTSGYVNKDQKIICKVNIISINLHNYNTNFVNLHIFNLTNMNNFKS